MNNLDTWWSSLPTAQKERIAAKAASKGGMIVPTVVYPGCTRWWLSLDDETKQTIHDHCTDKHGLLLPDWNDAKGMSY